MIRSLDLQGLEGIVQGHWRGADARFAALSTDTRSLQPGDLYVALRGERFDGHDFLAEAAARGAVAALVERELECPLPTVRVADSRKALGQLGAWNRAQSRARVVGLTGSQGKTTVKELTARILEACGPTLMTRGNLNNDLGVPLTLLGLGEQHDFAVIEMGANAPGEIAYVAGLARPDIAHITNAAATHLAGFGSLDGVAQAKGEIWAALPAQGCAVINLDDAYAELWRARVGARRCVSISAEGRPDADYRLADLRLDPAAGSHFRLLTPQGERQLQLNLLGAHNAANALAACALALEAGAGLDDLQPGLARMQPVSGRLCLRPGRHGARILDDSYNASPASFRAAIDVLARLPGERLLALGDMGELGTEAEQAHEEVGRYAREQGVAQLYAIGPLSALSARGFGDGALHGASHEALADAILPRLKPGVTVLVKGSRSAGMEKLVKLLLSNED